MRKREIGSLLLCAAVLLLSAIQAKAEENRESGAGPPVIRKWDKHKLLWEYNKVTGVYKQFRYEVAGRQWALRKVTAALNIDRNQKVDQNDPFLYRLNYDVHGRFENMVHNGATLKRVPNKELPSLAPLDHSEKKKAVFQVLSGDRLSYIQEMEENKEQVARMQRSGELDLSRVELANLLKLLDQEVSRTKRHLKDLENYFMKARIHIEQKHGTCLVGRQNNCKMIEAEWDGLLCSREVRYNPWTGRPAYEKVFEQGLAKEFYELPDGKNRRLLGQYQYVGSQMTHIVLYDSGNNPSREIYFNSTGVSRFRPLYTYRPYGLKIRVSKNKVIPWPPKLEWPVEPELIDFLMCHNDHAILPVRAVR